LKKKTLIYLLIATVLLSGCSTFTLWTKPTTIEMKVKSLTDSLLVLPLENVGASVAVVINASDGNDLYRHDALRQMLPASIQKLIVAADALYHLPEDFRWQTEIYSTSEIDSSGTLCGDLVVEGGWDPSLSGDIPYSDWPWENLENWADQLYEQGLRKIEGNLVGIGQIYVPGGWEVGDLPYRYAPAISQLMWNDGLITSFAGEIFGTEIFHIWPDVDIWTSQHSSQRLIPGNEVIVKKKGPVAINLDPLWPGENKTDWFTVYDPRLLLVDAFRKTLRDRGIEVSDSTRVFENNSRIERNSEGVGFTHFSSDLDVILEAVLQISSNGWAEQIGATVEQLVDRNDVLHPEWEAVLDSLRIDKRNVRSSDYCGMARANNITAATFSEFLIEAHKKWGDRWLNLLPHANQYGSTLTGRMEGLEKRVIAKSGSLSRCRSLAGYILQDGEAVASFTVMINNSPESPNDYIDKYINALVRTLDRHSHYEESDEF
jgi:serine-type D-Ala-D-Ala carboxypeptidase/endopeptidase (penicillin-binding protein 4)